MPQCLTPYDVRNKQTGNTVTVPCGKCVTCILRKGSEWSFRLMEEEKHCNTAYFITLTYDNANIPITAKKWMGLDKRDVQNFFKRLRSHTDYSRKERKKTPYRTQFNVHSYGNSSEPKKIKYYAVGEYGGRTRRPHYHAIIFNADIELIFKAWDKGQIHVGTVTQQSVGYCMKYMLKKGTIPLHANDDRPKEFALMSKGLGLSYVNPENIKWHTSSLDRLYLNVKGGIKCSMPRYYKEKIYEGWFREMAGLRQLERMEKERYQKRIDENGVSWFDYRSEYMEMVKVSAALQSNTRKQFLSLKNQLL